MASTVETERVDAPPAQPATPRARWARRLAPFALVFFFGPLALQVAGVRTEPFENRPLADFPSVSDGWDFLPGLQRWADDNLPLRREAVRADRTVSGDVFGDPPPVPRAPTGPGGVPGATDPGASPAPKGGDVQYPQVLQGKDGWLFYGGDASLPCQPVRSVDESLRVWNTVVDALASSGRRVVVTVAPDKSSMVPGRLPDRYVGKECSTTRTQDVRARLGAGALRSYVDLRAPLLREQEEVDEPIYVADDTHWDGRGAVVFAQTVLDALVPGRFSVDEDCVRGVRQQPGDLSKLAGNPGSVPVQTRTVDRPGVTFGGRELAPSDGTVQRVRSTTTGPPLVPGRVAIVGDSFLYASREQLLPYFADVTVAHKNRSSAADLLAVVRAADTVVLEIVEREFAAGQSGRFSPELARQIAALPPPPGR